MMGYNEIANQDQLNFLDPKGSNSHKLRPLAPRLLNFSPPNYNTSLSLNYTNYRDQNHHVGGVVGLSEESNNKEMVGTTNQVMVSSRWNPTPEQLRALEDLYRRGTRTPSAEQIQHITAQLRRYGKIEGKNVFYWFQNHKARERQKRRRQLQLHPSSPGSTTTSGGNKVGFEGEQKSCKWTPSSTINKESDHPISQIISEATEAKADETSTITATTHNPSWIQFHDPPQFQHNHTANNNINNIISGTNLMFARERNVTCQTQNNNVMVQQQPYSMSSPSCFQYHPSQSHPLISLGSLLSSKNNATTATATTTTTSILSNNHMLPDNQIVNNCEFETPPSSPTLQLFPIHVRNNNQENIDNDDINVEMSKDEDIENDASLLLLQTTCCNLVEKGTNIANSISNNNNNNNNNNPFPYYQFL